MSQEETSDAIPSPSNPVRPGQEYQVEPASPGGSSRHREDEQVEVHDLAQNGRDSNGQGDVEGHNSQKDQNVDDHETSHQSSSVYPGASTDPTSTHELNPLYPSYESHLPIYDPYPRSLDTLAEAADAEALGTGVGTGNNGNGVGVGVGATSGTGNVGSGGSGAGDFGGYENLHDHFGLGALSGIGGMGFGSPGMGVNVGSGMNVGVGVGMGSGVGLGVGGGQVPSGQIQGQGQGKRAESGARGMPYHFNHPSGSDRSNLETHTSGSTTTMMDPDHPSSFGGGQQQEYQGSVGSGTGGEGAQEELLDENGVPILGGANARIQDDKQRKRIMQACEPCRVRKARCNGLQPCGRCTTRNLDCVFAHERKMRGPNKVKKTAEMKAQQRADRSARQAAKQRDGPGQGGHDDGSRAAQQMVVNAMGGTAGAMALGGQPGQLDLTLDTASRYDHMHGVDAQGDKNGLKMKQYQQQQQQQQQEYEVRRQEFLASYGTDGLGRDSYDRTGQQAGHYFSLAPDTSSSNGFGYPPSTGQSVAGTEYYSSFSRTNDQDSHIHNGKSTRHDDRDGRGSGQDQNRSNQLIDDRLDDSSEAQDRARLVSLIGAGARFDATEGNDSPGRNNSQANNGSALAAYLLPEGDAENVGEYSPSGTGDGVAGGQW